MTNVKNTLKNNTYYDSNRILFNLKSRVKVLPQPGMQPGAQSSWCCYTAWHVFPPLFILWSTVFLHVFFCPSKKSSESHPSLRWSQKHESMIVWCGHWRSLECFGWGVLAASGKMRVPQRSLALISLLKFEVKKWDDTLDLVIFLISCQTNQSDLFSMAHASHFL